MSVAVVPNEPQRTMVIKLSEPVIAAHVPVKENWQSRLFHNSPLHCKAALKATEAVGALGTPETPETPEIPETSRTSKCQSWLQSRKWLLAAAVIVLILVAIICAVVATLLHRRGSDKKLPIKHPSGFAPFNEALKTNFPDPAILKHNGTWYAFATNNAAGVLHQPNNKTLADYGKSNVQLATSLNFNTWTLHNYTEDPLPTLGDWVASGYLNISEANATTPLDASATNPSSANEIPRSNVWAPDLLQRPSDGKFVLYYSATAASASRSHCVGAAVADLPQGPYSPLPTPFACPTELGGAIDPSPIVDVDGTIYVTYKIDGNNHGHGGICGNTVPPLVDTPILLQRFAEDAVTPVGSPFTILHRTSDDGPLVEAPALVRSDEGVYFLFFSSGCTRMPSYDLKYATSTKITGPYKRASRPLLMTGDWDLLAPGSVSVRRDESLWRMAFHARVMTPFGGVREMFTATLILNGTTVTFDWT
ncbi:glycoside hydrolase family 43 protein [Glonium stellatum]|uniref:Glycoside hydrolase family 43 protein n=1 Tax=Glonium stellatum TaxID=574774 RepID=A0A8E2ELZ8_9PEZI|nr:glycoside hydrolase family 43 protein [Glonium stellatum]